MLNTQEIETSDWTQLPLIVYHMVPQIYFTSFTDLQGNYDCRNNQKWGKESPYIHTTTSLKNLRDKISDSWQDLPKDWKFYLLKINTSKIPPSVKITYTVCNGVRYFHIWGALCQDSYIISEVTRLDDGSFYLI